MWSELTCIIYSSNLQVLLDPYLQQVHLVPVVPAVLVLQLVLAVREVLLDQPP